MTIDPNLLFAAFGSIGTGGIVWGATRQKLKSVDDFKKSFDKHVDQDHSDRIETVQRLSKLETMVGDIHRVIVK